MFQMADQSKATIREVPMISKQLPKVLNSAKIFFILFQSMPKSQSINVPNSYFTEITTFQLINLIKSDLIQIQLFISHN